MGRMEGLYCNDSTSVCLSKWTLIWEMDKEMERWDEEVRGETDEDGGRGDEKEETDCILSDDSDSIDGNDGKIMWIWQDINVHVPSV